MLPLLLLPVWFLASTAAGQVAFQRELRLSTSRDLRDLAANESHFVGVGRAGLVVTSPDGLHWTDQDAGTYESFNQVHALNGGFIATGDAGSLFHSPDGKQWEQRLAAIQSSSLMMANGILLVATQNHPEAWLRSTDGINWTPTSPGFSAYRHEVAGSLFFVTDGQNRLFASADGLRWQAAVFDEPVSSHAQLVSADGIFLSRSQVGETDALFRSTDGISWSRVPLEGVIVSLSNIQATFYRQLNNDAHEASTDGLLWTPIAVEEIPDTTAYDTVLNDITLRTHDLNRSIGGAEFTATATPLGSIHSQFPSPANTIAFGHGQWASTAGLFSTDGQSWTTPESSENFDANLATTISYAGEAFFLFEQVFVREHPRRTWVARNSSPYVAGTTFTHPIVPTVSSANGVYIIREYNTTAIHRSTDGLVWTRHPDVLPPLQNHAGRPIDETEHTSRQLLAFDDAFLLHTPGVGLFRSVDGLVWEFVDADLEIDHSLHGLSYHAGVLVAHDGESIWTSTDAHTWQRSTAPPLNDIDRALYSGSHLIAIGRDIPRTDTLRHLVARDDGGNWTRAVLASDGDVHGLATGNGFTLAAIGSQVWSARDGVGPSVVVEGDNSIETFANLPVELDATIQSPRPVTTQWAQGTLNIHGANTVPLRRSFPAPDDSQPRAFVLKVNNGAHITSVVYYLTLHPDTPPQAIGTGIYTVSHPNAGGGFTQTINARVQGPQLEYHWTVNGHPTEWPHLSWEIPINAFTTGDTYQLTVTNPAGSFVSDPITIEKPALSASEIQPYASSGFGGSGSGVKVEAEGAWGYQWRHNGQPIDGATDRSLMLRSNPQSGPSHQQESGFYDVLIYNDAETLYRGPYRFQNPADALLPDETPTYSWEPLRPPHLINLSVRAETTVGQTALVPGFVVSGDNVTDRETSAQILIRAIGPGLAQHGVTDAIEDPRLQLRDRDDHLITQNFRWEDAPQDLTPAFEDVGAFPLQAGSADAALLHAIPAQSARTLLTASAVDTAGATGETLVELYLLPDGNGSHLTNLSARGTVQPDHPLITGFAIEGAGTLRLMMRAIGPGLDDFGVPDPAGAPRLYLYDAASQLIAVSDLEYPVWLDDIQNSVGAFPVRPRSPNGVIIRELPAGTYTLQAHDATGGTVLIEVYLLPLPASVVIEVPTDNIPTGTEVESPPPL